MDKETFERAFEEFQELSARIEKLRAFLQDKEKIETLDMLNRDLLITQFHAMETYQATLSIRLGLNQPMTDQPEEETSSNEL